MKKAPWPPATHRQLARPARIRPVGLGPAPPPIGEQHKASTGPQLATLLHFLTHVNMQGWPPLLFSFSRMGQANGDDESQCMLTCTKLAYFWPDP